MYFDKRIGKRERNEQIKLERRAQKERSKGKLWNVNKNQRNLKKKNQQSSSNYSRITPHSKFVQPEHDE